MGKRVVTVGIVVAVLLGLPVLAAVTLPAVLFTQSLSPGVNFSPVGYATLTSGRGVLASREGADILGWAWCPTEGLTALCISATGKSGFFQGVAGLAVGGINIRQVTFTGLDAGILGIPGVAVGAQLSGDLSDLNYHWGDRCLQRGLVSATGAVLLTGIADGGYRVTVEGDGQQGFSLGGDFVEGKLDLTENRMTGVLKVAMPSQTQISGNPMEIKVARHIGCRR